MSAKSCHDPRCGNESFHPSMRMPGFSGVAMGFMKDTERYHLHICYQKDVVSP